MSTIWASSATRPIRAFSDRGLTTRDKRAAFGPPFFLTCEAGRTGEACPERLPCRQSKGPASRGEMRAQILPGTGIRQLHLEFSRHQLVAHREVEDWMLKQVQHDKRGICDFPRTGRGTSRSRAKAVEGAGTVSTAPPPPPSAAVPLPVPGRIASRDPGLRRDMQGSASRRPATRPVPRTAAARGARKGRHRR